MPILGMEFELDMKTKMLTIVGIFTLITRINTAFERFNTSKNL